MRRRLQAGAQDAGAALLMVVGIGLVLVLLVATAMTVSVSGYVKSLTDENWNAAMAAAYAGIEEYESRIADDSAYVRYGNAAAAFSAGSTLTLPTGSATNPAFGTGGAGSWGLVAGSTAKFRYEIDNTQYATTGLVRIRSTGRAGTLTRSVVANLKQKGFIDYLYFTDFEIRDPALSGVDVATCVKYSWAGRPAPSSALNCGEVAFGNSDEIDGPAHSNDTMRVCDAEFKSTVSTGFNPATGLRYKKESSGGSGCGGQIFDSGAPVYSPVVAMPATNSLMKREVRSDLATDVPNPGCLYTGPTTIELNASGTMTVRSPWTKKTNVSGDPAISGTTPAACGLPGTGTGQLGSTLGATIGVLDANLVYVQNVATVATDPNFWAASAQPSTFTATTCTTGNGLGFPMAGEFVDSIPTSFGCRNGDAFVQGVLKGAMTVASENFLYITEDIRYGNSSRDILGLVGQNAVWIWNPVSKSASGVYTNLLPNNRRIDAALLSVAHTVQVQNYNRAGDQGDLSLNGALAQKFRGTVGTVSPTSSTGYSKDYEYDDRFLYVAPPKFLSPVATTYGVGLLTEVKSAYLATGVVAP
ncbi:hypothetical protein E3T55_01055 [Cryobacterium frigoriphilum]|uniref:Type 4 fimbrial biogenesis protein PilX N-terminal domain-containing protein n=1 Tax=Cryobacterium frigoriphilum TaxID=1259150 RepID=A0A4R9AAV9_9MICO|nr:hypothetical protein [Cryobacterium frigoriphilum]TFD55448.1 hypothetical protein E3T55_01055 [Cryobacterium frigoriphilum]